jgi:Ca2+-transporting ATPase
MLVASQLSLLSFSSTQPTIFQVDGVEEGRGIYANIQAFINFLISCNVGEVLAVFFASFMGFPSILSAMQLLWVNLVTDGPAAVALGFNPIDKDVMKERPRDVNEAIMTPWLMTRYLLLGSYVGFATVGVFAFHYISEGVSLNQLSHWSACSTTSDFDLCNSLFGPDALVIPQTLALSTLVTIELLKAISTVSVDGSLFKISPLSNPYLILGVTIPFAFHLMILYTPISTSFGLSPLSIEQWTTVLLWSLPVIFIDEFLKAVGRKIKS